MSQTPGVVVMAVRDYHMFYFGEVLPHSLRVIDKDAAVAAVKKHLFAIGFKQQR